MGVGMSRRFSSILVSLTTLSCATTATGPHAGVAELTALDWSEVPGWAEDDHAAAYATFLASCAAVVRAPAGDEKLVGTTALKSVCERALDHGPLEDAAARQLFEESFAPMRISAPGETDGLITAYYVPIFAGSRTATPEFSAPMYGKPKRAEDLTLTREQIETGALAGEGLELLYTDPIDAFFAQVQGSARVRLEDGSLHKLEYTAKTDQPYTSIGRVLVERGEVPREEMSMQRLRAWMTEHPDGAIELRRQNRAFVFFSDSLASEGEEGIGAQNLPLTPRRSIAVDSKLHAYGTPFFISAELPVATEEPTTPFRQLMIAMDTGTAIVGPARADIYWGVGDAAAEVAGRVKQRGTFYLLVPRESR
jgi:membrane-bound lytic murein transglycosylase A